MKSFDFRSKNISNDSKIDYYHLMIHLL